MRRGDVWNKGANIFASKEIIVKKNECLSRAKGNKYTIFGSCIDKEGHSVSLSGGKSRRRRVGRRRSIKNRSRRHRSRRARK